MIDLLQLLLLTPMILVLILVIISVLDEYCESAWIRLTILYRSLS